jgi:hypothetical protein
VRFASFLSSGFITPIVVNPPERKLAKRTSVCIGMKQKISKWLTQKTEIFNSPNSQYFFVKYGILLSGCPK